ncbi:MAG: hypothetical protein ACM3SQ_20080 [Betaproteobacteria bacterium]
MHRGLVLAAVCLTPALVVAAGLTYTTPSGWRTQPPGSSMRVAQFVLPRAAGDPADAELVVYYFGGEGGGVEANVQRWIGQMQQPGGGSSEKVARRETKTVNGLKLTLLDVTGTYVAEMMPGAAEHHDNPHYRMRAGVVETPRGPYFIKLVGPTKTVAKWDEAFNAFVGSLKYQ